MALPISSSSSFLLVLVMIVVFLRAINAIESKGVKKTREIVPGGFIVEFSPSWARLQTDDHHKLFYLRVAKMKTIVVPRRNFTSHVFIGASFQLENHDDMSVIEALDMVSNIWPLTIYSLPIPTVESIINWYDSINETYKDQFPPHVMTGVDKLHAQGYTGEGVFVAIIDSGVDYRHPALGGGFGKGYKIQIGRDFVGDNYTGYNLPIPDNNPLDCIGHGTHVTGIIGADAPMFTGVAPNATLGMYRVFGCDGSTTNDVLIEAYSAAYEDSAQIITASLGGASGWAEDPLAIVVSRIASTGVFCTVAAGNAGNEGLFFTLSPATGFNVIAVGSVDSIAVRQFMYQGYSAINSGLNFTFQYFPAIANVPFPSNISGYSLYPLSFNTSNPADACSELPSNTSVLSGKIILIRRGTCDFVTKIANVQKFGAQYVIFYNNENPIVSPQTTTGVFAAMVSAEIGAQWIMNLKEGNMVNVSFPDNSIATTVDLSNNITGGYMSTFSSWSPTNELFIKPEISAPGGNILSTYLTTLGYYAVLSGTSMSTPYIAGVLALYKSANDSQQQIINYQTLRQILSTTATPLSFNDGNQTYPYLAPVVQQGGGLVNAFAVIHYSTIISPGTLTLNDTVNFNQKVEFTINNTNSMSVSYTLTHQAAATAYALGVNTTFPQIFPPTLNTQYATAIISPSTLTIPGQSIAVINVVFLSPMNLEIKRIPVFSGYINITSSINESFHLPYAGVGCNMKQVMVTDFEYRSPYISNSSDSNSIPNPVAANATFNVTTDLPNFNWRMVMGSSVVRLDILGNGNQTQVAGVNILGSIPDFPQYWMPRNYLVNKDNDYTAVWNGTLSTGVQVPAGNYMLLYRALKIFEDPNNNSDYENWTSPLFGIQYQTFPNNSSAAMTNKGQHFFLFIISFLFILNLTL